MEDIPQYPGYSPSKQCYQNCIYNTFHLNHSSGHYTQISKNRLYPLQKFTGKFMRFVIHNHKHFIMIITKRERYKFNKKPKTELKRSFSNEQTCFYSYIPKEWLSLQVERITVISGVNLSELFQQTRQYFRK